MRTRYEPEQAEFSQSAHKAARRDLYPALFGTEDLQFSNVALHGSAAARVLDMKLGIDVIVYPAPPEKLSARLPYYVQERFRRPEYETHNDVTITEFNHASETPSELYKLGADLVLYGLYDLPEDGFTKACAVDALRVKVLLATGGLAYTVERNKKQQSFLGLPLAELRRVGCLVWEMKVQAGLDAPDSVLASDLFDWYSGNDGWLPEKLRGSK